MSTNQPPVHVAEMTLLQVAELLVQFARRSDIHGVRLATEQIQLRLGAPPAHREKAGARDAR